MKKKIMIRIVNIVLITVFVFSTANIVKILYDYGKADNAYSKMQEQYIDESDKLSNESESTLTVPITIDFDSLLAKNKDVTGWIYCPDTVVNYPVVQGKDNNKYLRRDLDGKYLVSGTIFADYRNGALGEDCNYIIYGHNMKNGTMFNSLAKYKKQAFFDKHPIMYYLTPNGNYKLELFAGLVVKRDDKIYNLNLDKEEFSKLLDDYQAKSTFKSDVKLENNDTVVTLSTCSYEFDNARYIVIARLVPV